MIRMALIAATLLAQPVLAQAHEIATGPLAGRSPHTAVRPIARASVECAKPLPHLPAGKLAVFGAPRGDCAPAIETADRGGGAATRIQAAD